MNDALAILHAFYTAVDRGHYNQACKLVTPDFRMKLEGDGTPLTFDDYWSVVIDIASRLPGISHHIDDAVWGDGFVAIMGRMMSQQSEGVIDMAQRSILFMGMVTVVGGQISAIAPLVDQNQLASYLGGKSRYDT